MKLKNCLYIASVLILLGCNTGAGDAEQTLRKRVDSLSASHRSEVDSLSQVIKDLKTTLDELRTANTVLQDSIREMEAGSGKNGKKGGPNPNPEGIPITFPSDKK